MESYLISPRSFLVPALTWWCIWIGVSVYIIYYLGFSWEIAAKDGLTSMVILVACGMGIRNLLRYYQPGKQNLLYMMIWNLAVSGVYVIAFRWVMHKWMFNHDAYLSFLEQSLPVRYFFALLMFGFVSLMNWMWYYLNAGSEEQNRLQQTERLKREAELAGLRMQMQPHFLFNSLNSISALTLSKPEEARKMIQLLSDFLRGTVKKEPGQLIPLHEELKHLQLYLEIEKVRFGHRLQTTISCAENCSDKNVPVLILQPIVENAIKFGLYDTTGEVSISIQAHCDNTLLYISVSNPFDEQTSVPKQGTGFGLNAVQRRLYLLFARNDLLKTFSSENKFITEIQIPQA